MRSNGSIKASQFGEADKRPGGPGGPGGWFASLFCVVPVRANRNEGQEQEDDLIRRFTSGRLNSAGFWVALHGPGHLPLHRVAVLQCVAVLSHANVSVQSLASITHASCARSVCAFGKGIPDGCLAVEHPHVVMGFIGGRCVVAGL
jgi:hypothetical protein